MVVTVLCQIKDMSVSGPVEEQYPGIYLLMVHPNETVCFICDMFLVSCNAGPVPAQQF